VKGQFTGVSAGRVFVSDRAGGRLAAAAAYALARVDILSGNWRSHPLRPDMLALGDRG